MTTKGDPVVIDIKKAIELSYMRNDVWGYPQLQSLYEVVGKIFIFFKFPDNPINTYFSDKTIDGAGAFKTIQFINEKIIRDPNFFGSFKKLNKKGNNVRHPQKVTKFRVEEFKRHIETYNIFVNYLIEKTHKIQKEYLIDESNLSKIPFKDFMSSEEEIEKQKEKLKIEKKELKNEAKKYNSGLKRNEKKEQSLNQKIDEVDAKRKKLEETEAKLNKKELKEEENKKSKIKDGCIPLISGVLTGIDPEDDKIFSIKTSDKISRRVFLNSKLQPSATCLKKLLSSTNKVIDKKEIEINFTDVELKKDNIYLKDELESLLIIEPEWLINVSALSVLNYCDRNLLNNRFSFNNPSEYMIRGSIVHKVFESIIKFPLDLEKQKKVLKDKFRNNALEFALNCIDYEAMYKNFIKLHLNKLVKYRKSIMSKSSDVNTESFILNPILGLKGKIDATVEEVNGVKAIELKTGKSGDGKAKPGDKFQAQAYSLMMEMKFKDKKILPPSVIYSGGDKWVRRYQSNNTSIEKRVDFNYESKAYIANLRNKSVLADYLFYSEYEKINPNKCKNCVRQNICRNLSQLELEHDKSNKPLFNKELKEEEIEKQKEKLKIEKKELKNEAKKYNSGLKRNEKKEQSLNQKIDEVDAKRKKLEETEAKLNKIDNKEKYLPKEKEFFNKYNKLLTNEYRIIKQSQGEYLNKDVDDRIEDRKCVKIRGYIPLKNNKYILYCKNESELRESGKCLLSDSSGPVEGGCLQVTITEVKSDSITIESRAAIEFIPAFIDFYEAETTFERNYPAVYELINNPALERIKDILLNDAKPALNKRVSANISKNKFKNHKNQQKCIELSLGLEDYLLIQGPPGTGKTRTIAMIVKELCKKNKAILIACYTHRAIDEVIRKITKYAPHVSLYKIGSWGTEPEKKNINLEYEINKQKELYKRVKKAREIIESRPVYIGTTHAWLSGNYNRLVGDNLYDVAIIDEAAQVILPNTFGVMQLVKKFILVGDHKQLPPVIQSEKAKKELTKTLFETLQDKKYRNDNINIMLDVQHRMAAPISKFISKEFYDGKLRDSKKAESRKLKINSSSMDNSKIINPDKPLTLVNIKTDLNTTRIRTRTSTNETKKIVSILSDLLKANISPNDIGIIAPFRAQVQNIKRGIENDLLKYFNESTRQIKKLVDTVDRFQGDQKDIIIFSLTLLSKKIPEILTDERRLNVAISRARKKFIGVGNWDLVDGNITLKNLREHAKSSKGCIFVSE